MEVAEVGSPKAIRMLVLFRSLSKRELGLGNGCFGFCIHLDPEATPVASPSAETPPGPGAPPHRLLKNSENMRNLNGNTFA